MFVGKDFTPAVINEVQKDSPAENAGMMKNDVILEIDDKEIKSILDVSKFISLSTSEFIDFKILRLQDELILKVRPDLIDS